MKLSIDQDTIYSYQDQVLASIQYLRLTPQESGRQHVLSWDLQLPHAARAQRDPHGNILHVLTLDEPHESISIHSRGEVEIDETREAEADAGSPLPYLRTTRLTHADEALREFALRHSAGRRDRPALIGLMEALAEYIVYSPGATQVESSAAEAFAGRAGVCQDHAHAFLACARSLGVPARYVSGYLYCGGEGGALASHAWAEAWIDGAWYSFDVTNGLARPDRHLKLAVGLDYLDACPVRGMCRGGGEQMHARVRSLSLRQPWQSQQLRQQ